MYYDPILSGSAFAKLTVRERKVMILRAGLNGLPPHTYQEIAHQFGMSIYRTKQIVKKAEDKIVEECKQERDYFVEHFV